MKIIYIAETRLPSEMAQGLQVMKMCEALTRQGAEIELIVPMRFKIFPIEKKDPFEYYKLDKIFKIRKIFCLDLTPLNRFLGPISFLIQAFSFSFFAAVYVLFKKADIIYGRDRFTLFFLSFLKSNIVFEAHKIYKLFFKQILKKAKVVVVITSGLKEALIKSRIDKNKILIAPDAVDLNDFKIEKTKEECRKELDLPQNKKLVLYTGHLYQWKGVETLALASRYLDDNTLTLIVGGIKWYLADFKKFIAKNNLKNILILEYQEHSKIPYFLKAADCVVLTGTQKSEISNRYTSPMKMFEYMASEKPIVASDLPSLAEVLNTTNSVLVDPDNPEKMAQGIKAILNNLQLSEKISKQAYNDVQKHTWDNRAKKILEFICAE